MHLKWFVKIWWMKNTSNNEINQQILMKNVQCVLRMIAA